ncbi:MAG: transketolase [Clostridia bacterium]|nr:transketolase [Clostridia bacterium]
MDSQKLSFLQDKAAQIRKITIEMIGRLGSGHVGGSLSIVDVLTDIYYNVGNMSAAHPDDPNRDRVVVSKGHAGPALYAVLADKGYFPIDNIKTLNQGGTSLPSHCDMNKTVGVDMTAGSLGQGLSCAVGMALAAKMDKKSYRTYCIIGDGESQEGQIWEALMYAGNMGLDNLTIFIDYNRMQIDGYTDEINSLEPLPDKYKAFNLNTLRVDGHDIAAIDDAIAKAKAATGKCTVIILDTIKGHGVPWAEDKGVGSHSFAISESQWREFCGKEKD